MLKSSLEKLKKNALYMLKISRNKKTKYVPDFKNYIYLLTPNINFTVFIRVSKNLDNSY